MTTKLRRNGKTGSYIITLPMAQVHTLGWKEGDVFEVNREGRKLVVSKARGKR